MRNISKAYNFTTEAECGAIGKKLCAPTARSQTSQARWFVRDCHSAFAVLPLAVIDPQPLTRHWTADDDGDIDPEALADEARRPHNHRGTNEG